MLSSRLKKSGFNFNELLVVIAIALALISVLSPVLGSHKDEDGRRAVPTAAKQFAGLEPDSDQ